MIAIYILLFLASSNNLQLLTDISVLLGFFNHVRLAKSSKHNIKVKRNVFSLTVNHCDHTDAGIYCVSISNGIEFIKQTVELKVVVKPKVKAEKTVNEQSCIIGHDAKISWKFSGITKSQITWLFNKQSLPNNERFQITGTDDGTSILTIRNTELTDKGTYTAKAINSVGEAEAKTTLDIVGIKPVIKTNIDADLQVTKDELLTIKLSANGTPKPDIIWTNNNVKLASTDRICMNSTIVDEENTYVLTIKNVQSEDQGVYSAELTNVFGSIKSKKCKVTVIKSPVFISKPTSQQVKQNETAVFETKIDGYPTPEVTWFLNGKPLTGKNDTRIEFNPTTGDAKLSIQNTDLQQHTGLVKCRLENIHGDQEETVRLDILTAPFIKTHLPKKEDIVTGKNITLRVVAHGFPQPQAEWFYNNTPIATENTSYSAEKNEYQLTINKVIVDAHQGTYQVSLKNIYGEIRSTCALTVLEPAKITKMTPETNVVDLKVSEPFKFSADIKGKEAPKVQLTKDDKEVPFTSIEDTRHTYSIPEVKLEHKRVYKRTAKNKASTEETSVTLNIITQSSTGFSGFSTLTSGTEAAQSQQVSSQSQNAQYSNAEPVRDAFVSHETPTVDNNHEVYLKSEYRIVISGKTHNSGTFRSYLFPILENQEKCVPQALIVKLIQSAERPLQHLDRILIDTKENSTYGNSLGAFSFGLYYYEYRYVCQVWEIIRTAGEGKLKYEDTFILKNCHYTDEYLYEYYSDKWKAYYLTTSKTPTTWRFGHVNVKKISFYA